MTKIAGQRKRTFTAAEDAYLTEQRGRMSSIEIGAVLGRSEDAIRRRWRLIGHANSRKPRPERKPPKPPRVSVAANDAELIAAYLANNAITILPSGPAAGLSALEIQFGAVRPPNSGWISQSQRHRKARAA